MVDPNERALVGPSQMSTSVRSGARSGEHTQCCIQEFTARIKRQKDAAEARNPDGRKVQARRELASTEHSKTDERGFEEEGEEPLDRERRTEDIADKYRIDRPVHSELELEHDLGDDSDGEIDEEEPSEKDTKRIPRSILAAVAERLQPSDNNAQTDRRWDEEEVEDDREPKLSASQIECILRLGAPFARNFPASGARNSSKRRAGRSTRPKMSVQLPTVE